MKKFRRIFSIGLLLLCACLSISCSKNDEDDVIMVAKDLNLTILNKNYNYYNYGYATFILEKFNLEKRITSNVLTFDGDFDEMAKTIFQQYQIPLSSNENIKSITFYGKSLDLNLNNGFTGFSIMKESAVGFKQEVYKVENGIATIQQKYSREYHHGIFLESFGFFAYEIEKQNDSFVLLLNPSFKKNSDLQRQSANYDLDLAYLEQFPFIMTQEKFYGSRCTASGCGSTGPGICGVDGGADVKCNAETPGSGGGGCLSDDSDEANTEIGDTEKINLPAKEAMYEIRNGFLSLSSKGKQYIDYYYKLSYVLKITGGYDKTLSDTNEMLEFVNAKSLLFVEANNNVIITQADANYIKSKINNYKGITSNAEYKSILSTIEIDITNITNKSKSEIMLYLL